MKKLLNDINKLHVNYEVLVAAVLHLTEAEQVKVNKLITEALGLPLRATDSSILQERQKKVDDVNDYSVILDAFAMLKDVTARLSTVDGSCEVLADAQMLIASIENEKQQ